MIINNFFFILYLKNIYIIAAKVYSIAKIHDGFKPVFRIFNQYVGNGGNVYFTMIRAVYKEKDKKTKGENTR